MKYKRLIVKIGTNVITNLNGTLNKKVMSQLVDQVSALKKQGIQVIMVSSGAMGAGRSLVSLPTDTHEVVKRQVMAAVGQSRLMKVYNDFFEMSGYLSAQVLATKEDFRDRHHYLNMKACMEALLKDQIVPIVNENDVISVDELMFTDNDELAALLASMMKVDALILLTSVQGVLDDKGQVIPKVDTDLNLQSFIKAEKSAFGRGGMQTKCRMAKRAAQLGISTYIADGKNPTILTDFIQENYSGTLFLPNKKASTIKGWLAYSEGQEKGSVLIDEQAVQVLQSEKAASLLPVGIINVNGEFKKGDLIKIMNEKREVIGIGSVQYGADKAREWRGFRSKKALIHYDYLMIY